MLTRDQADILCTLLDKATESNWPPVAEGMLEAGHEPKEIVEAATALCKLAGRRPMLEEGDFSC